MTLTGSDIELILIMAANRAETFTERAEAASSEFQKEILMGVALRASELYDKIEEARVYETPYKIPIAKRIGEP